MSEYANWMEKQGYDSTNRRFLKGTYKNSRTGNEISGDNFMCIVVDDDAEKSYKKAIEFYNETLRDGETARIFVRAEWCKNE